MTNLFNMTKKDLEEYFVSKNEKPFRATQIYEFLYKKRIYNVNENSILLDGVDIMDLPIKQVRESVSFVPQDNFLFSDTIANNIGFSNIAEKYDISIRSVYSINNGSTHYQNGENYPLRKL